MHVNESPPRSNLTKAPFAPPPQPPNRRWTQCYRHALPGSPPSPGPSPPSSPCQVEDHSAEVLASLRRGLAADLEIYAHGASLEQSKTAAIPGFEAALATYEQLEAKIDQSCKFVAHDSKQLIGHDCYTLKAYDAENIGTSRGRAGARPRGYGRR